jgi:hypothetical protein
MKSGQRHSQQPRHRRKVWDDAWWQTAETTAASKWEACSRTRLTIYAPRSVSFTLATATHPGNVQPIIQGGALFLFFVCFLSLSFSPSLLSLRSSVRMPFKGREGKRKRDCVWRENVCVCVCERERERERERGRNRDKDEGMRCKSRGLVLEVGTGRALSVGGRVCVCGPVP